ncbi:hypothetical protein GCK32_010044, partial [Trichostrongylus colubriformis]
VLERNEWKPYKNSIIQWKKVKHCSRNFFKTCDTDTNRKLTIEEWKKCFAPNVVERSKMKLEDSIGDLVEKKPKTLRNLEKGAAYSLIQKTPAVRPDQLNPFLYILKAD